MRPELAERSRDRSAWPRRFTVVALFFVATVLCYVDRVSISVAIIPLSRDRGYDAAAQGIILSAFFSGCLWPRLLVDGCPIASAVGASLRPASRYGR